MKYKIIPQDCISMDSETEKNGLMDLAQPNPALQLVSSLMCISMAPHSSTLAWKIPWMEGPGRLQSMGSLRVGHD